MSHGVPKGLTITLSDSVLPALLLAGCFLVGLILVPLGLPGLWVMVAGVLGYGWLTDFRTVGVVTIAVALGLAFLGALIASWLGFGVAALVGAPVPIIGSVIGAFVGSFAGAALLEYLRAWSPDAAVRAGGGAGRG